MKLLVGLGNPGATYARNRHNVGFMAVDRVAERHGLPPFRKRFQGEASEGSIDGERVLILKPQTYMNESGRSVGEAARFLKIDVGDIIVVYDEIDLLPGKLKAKTGGGNAGHNGLRSISAHIGNEYHRVRIGVGHPGDKARVAGYVLDDFSKAETTAWVDPLLDAIARHAGQMVRGEQGRFLAEVARRLGDGEEGATRVAGGARRATQPSEAAHKPDASRTTKRDGDGARHPAGERAGKRSTALQKNLEAWLAKRQPAGRVGNGGESDDGGGDAGGGGD